MMVWIDLPSADIDPDSPEKESVFTNLKARDDSLRTFVFYYKLAEVTETGQSFVTKDTFRIEVPDFATTLKIGVQLKIDSSPGGEKTQARIKITGGTDGTTIESVATTYEEKLLDLTLAGGEKGTVVTVEVQLLVDTGGRTASMKQDATDLRSRIEG